MGSFTQQVMSNLGYASAAPLHRGKDICLKTGRHDWGKNEEWKEGRWQEYRGCRKCGLRKDK